MSLTEDAKALLVASLPASVKVFIGRVTDKVTPQRFVIVSPSDGTRIKETYGGAGDLRESRVRLTVTATMPNGSEGTIVGDAEWLVDKCERALMPLLDHEGTRFMGEDENLSALQSAYFVADFVRNTP